MADGSVDLWGPGFEGADDFPAVDDLSMDLDSIFRILGEDPDDVQRNLEYFSLRQALPGALAPDSGGSDNSELRSGSQVSQGPSLTGAGTSASETIQFSYSPEGSDSGTGLSDGLFDSRHCHPLDHEYEKLKPSPQVCHPMHADFGDRHSLIHGDETCCSERNAASHDEMPTSEMDFTSTNEDKNHVSHCVNTMYHNFIENEAGAQFKHVGEDVDSQYVSESSHFECIDGNIENHVASGVNSLVEASARPDICPDAGFEMPFVDLDRFSHVASSSDSTICHSSNITYEYGDYHSSMQCCKAGDDRVYVPDLSHDYVPSSSSYQLFPNNDGMLAYMKHRNEEFLNDNPCTSSNVDFFATGKISSQSAAEVLTINHSDSKRWNIKPEGQCASFIAGNFPADKRGATDPLSVSQQYISSNHQVFCVNGERNDNQNSSLSSNAGFYANQKMDQFAHISRGQIYNQLNNGNGDLLVMTSDRASHHQAITDKFSVRLHSNANEVNLNSSEEYFPHAQPSFQSEKQLPCAKGEPQRETTQCIHHEDDFDVCIIEDISDPAPLYQTTPIQNPINASQAMQGSMDVVGCTRHKANDERYILRAALRDLSQPKSELSPPDGVLAVPLLRHQRIALSWMVQKETSSLHCSGGILADDQGLGKTVSTIALILKERPASFGVCQNLKKEELETLNLDEDEDMPIEHGQMKQEADIGRDMPNKIVMKRMDSLVQLKGRPSAGTLIVCPTSVLRQWAEELHNKVTGKGNLSVLVYHGSNRTKDPHELAKYDVVLTTYSIVTMEVPKKSLADKNNEEKGGSDDHEVPSISKKRKYPSSVGKKCKKLDSSHFDSVARPLAKVAWFRVVLDEAQSIKNHRTQVARACCGLRAKRRWCLSGTPIQNAIDDLYSYFRFLRYDPYAVYTSFCSTIKVPISRDPAKGYKKLQAVLKTIMLRRTKGTLLDGEPVINLPPKFVELKKVDFSLEEREFYTRLEADSRAQFQEYANAGTVKQNYVNILLMLLRLRQACDHPLLVRHYDSNSLWKSSVEIAKRLPREKQINLLNCFSSAICSACHDAPEDAVVSICGHVFCNQCISEHLTGDDSQCPARNCKVRLSISSVFSKATLNNSLSGPADSDTSPVGSDPKAIDKIKPYSCEAYDSSKIKAALEFLQSLSKPQQCRSTHSSTQSICGENNNSPVNSANACFGGSLEESSKNQNLDGVKSSKNMEKVAGEKAIVFSQWTRMLDLLEDCLKNSSIQYRRLDGTMSVMARDKAVKDFNTLPEVTVMIMSLKAASLGLNMVAACHVILLDLWWNPTTEDQAVDRAHRIGQTRPVTVLRLTVNDTVEDRILALQQKKRKMVASAFGEDGSGGRQTRLTVEDLEYLFRM